MESHELSRYFEFNGVRLPDINPSFRWRKSAPRTRTNFPISLRQQSLGRRRSETSCGIFSHDPSKSRVHLLFSSAWAFKPFPFEISLFPRPAGDWRRRYFFLELRMWPARMCFQSGLTGWTA
jgi:hypothetical protein